MIKRLTLRGVVMISAESAAHSPGPPSSGLEIGNAAFTVAHPKVLSCGNADFRRAAPGMIARRSGMSEGTAAVPGQRARAEVTPRAASWPDARRWLQLGLAAIWLLDAVLQYQSVHVHQGLRRRCWPRPAPGNPGRHRRPDHLGGRGSSSSTPWRSTRSFATIQLLLGLGIAWRPTVTAGARRAPSPGRWRCGGSARASGGVLSGAASPVNGAPGAVILYALLAVLLWPPPPREPAVAVRGRPAPVGARGRAAAVARAVGQPGLLRRARRATELPRGHLVTWSPGWPAGEPGWLSRDQSPAPRSCWPRRGLVAAVILAVRARRGRRRRLPARAARGAGRSVLAIVTAAVIWVVDRAWAGC